MILKVSFKYPELNIPKYKYLEIEYVVCLCNN